MSVRRAIALSPRSFYRYVTKTLGVDRLAASGCIDDLRNVHYVHNLFETLIKAIQQDTRDASFALPHALRLNGCEDLLRSFLSDQRGCSPTELRRRTVSMLECIGRAAGIDLDTAGVGASRPDEGNAPAAAAIEQELFPTRVFPHADESRREATKATQAALPVVLYVPHLRSPYNLGGMIRTAAAFGMPGVVVGEQTPDLAHPRVVRAAMGGADYVAVRRGTIEDAWGIIAEDARRANRETESSFGSLPGTVASTIALETGGTVLPNVTFPRSGVLIVGHEELGISTEFLSLAAEIATIPHGGPKASLNVGVAVGIALSWWNAALAEGRASITPD